MHVGQVNSVTIEQALSGEFGPLIDVRSEGEYRDATIPGAFNVPVLADEERKLVGTTYRQKGPEQARWLGLEIIGPKLPNICGIIRQDIAKGPAVLFCWRGGMRSKTMATILVLMGLEVYYLEGGYKAFRRFVNAYWDQVAHKKPLVMLHGNTGVGKTDILAGLNHLGVGVIDLEALAENRGSVFGGIGYGPGPSQQLFEARLVMALENYRSKPYMVVECESRRIGRNVLPVSFFQWMQAGPHIHVYADTRTRVDRLVNVYSTQGNAAELLAALQRLQIRLGKEKTKALSHQICMGNYAAVAVTLLSQYYDPLYRYPNGPSQKYDLSVDATSVVQVSGVIAAYLSSRFPG
ncbi:MAG: tRNA 2-selenouridine(34) synthase MnmH [Heliobacteriaceae bacterium]|nr:tRNA 2-selenouridine(34) synthase MnmH [Heliobacteriaceae bacterium]